jgi:DNA-binding SARP family transcriptional activator
MTRRADQGISTSEQRNRTAVSPALTIRVLGEFEVLKGKIPQTFPQSRKTRALLAYLILTGRRHRRERLCEMFWDLPDNPRASLRWSLSRLRSLVDTPGTAGMKAHLRSRVERHRGRIFPGDAYSVIEYVLMKNRVTLTMDPAIAKKAKRIAHARRTSVSALIEDLLRAASVSSKSETVSFADRWTGKLRLKTPAQPDSKFAALKKRYDLD